MVLFLTILFVLICVLLIGVILLQKGRGGGLSGAFGGADGHSAFGSRTGDMFTWITVVLVAVFLILSVVTVKYFRPPQVSLQQAPTGPPPADYGGTDAQPAAANVETQPVSTAAPSPVTDESAPMPADGPDQ
ncbi:MAG: preprotein translocase subunit SecG [Planctomycetes bacterium]|nr:preprotein translocase subunit SecG [Planctomycetota bacterium]